MSPHLLCIGGEDHHLRIPFLLALRERGFRITAAGTGDACPFARAGLAYKGFHFKRFLGPAADRTTVEALGTLIADARPDLVQSFDTKPNVLVPLAARRCEGVRVIRTINGMGWVYSSRSPLALALRPVQRALHRLAARSSTATVFQNCQDQAFFARHHLAGDGCSRLIPGSGVDVERFDRDMAGAARSDHLRDALGVGAAEIVITVARLTRQKGIPTLLKAAALVHRARPAARFLLVGPRESEGALAIAQAEIEKHAPYVLALGQRSDVPALLGLADVFAFPTEYREGVPRVLLEAGLAGLPMVTTDMPGCNDVVEDGRTGLLVPPRDPRSLADSILELLEDRDRARAMGRRAAQLVRREFSLALTVDRYCALYSELLEARPARIAPFVPAAEAQALLS